MNGIIRASVLLLALVCVTASTSIRAQSGSAPEAFTAVAINTGMYHRPGLWLVDIRVSRWSSEREKDRLTHTLFDRGPNALLGAVVDSSSVGTIRTPNTLAYDLRFAWQEPLPDGGRRIFLLTDRPIGFWEATWQPRSIDYPFTFIEIRLNADGEGEGKLSIATKISVNRSLDLIELEDYDTQPVRLADVRVQRRPT